MKRIFILLSFSFLCILSQSIASETYKPQGGYPCQDIKSVNSKDATIELNDSEIISFNSGYACPIDPDAGHCCLEYTVTADRLLRPDKQNDILMLVINRNMLCGSGNADYLLFYSCVNGSLKNVTKKEYEGGLKYEDNKNCELIVTSAMWQSNDAHCCPSMEKVEFYKWDSKSKTFIIRETETRARKRD